MPSKNNPDRAKALMIKSGYKPLEEYKLSDSKWKCVHVKCGEVVYPTYHQIKRGQGGCQSCAKKTRTKKLTIPNKLAKLEMINAGAIPLEPYSNVSKKWKSRCLECKKIIYPRLKLVREGKGTCVYCAGNKVDPKDAKKLAISKNLKPLESFKGSQTKWKCKCLKCGSVVYPMYSSLASGQGGCDNCRGIGVGNRQRRDQKVAIDLFLKANLKPLVPYKNSKQKWKSQCLLCNSIVHPTLQTVQDGHSGCRYCAPAGISMVNPTYIYLITHSELNAHKVGIGNVKNFKDRDRRDRLARLRKKGWQTHKVWNFKTGQEAIDFETAIFKIIRKDLKIPIYLTKADMPQTGGQAETMSADTITLLELEKVINKVIKGYRQ